MKKHNNFISIISTMAFMLSLSACIDLHAFGFNNNAQTTDQSATTATTAEQ